MYNLGRGSVCAFHVFCYAGKCFDTSVIDITFTTPYVFLYLEEVLEKNLKDSFNSSAIKYTLWHFFTENGYTQKVGQNATHYKKGYIVVIISFLYISVFCQMQS